MTQTPGLGLLTTDRALIVRSWNAWLAAATGIAEDRANGRPLLELIPPDRRELYRDILADVLERGAPRVLAPAFHHYILQCPPETQSRFFDAMQQRVTVAPLRADETVVGLIVTVEDMTAALEEQRELAAKIEQMDDGGSSRDALAAVGAEDWRVRGAAVRALRQSASAEDLAHLLQSLQRDHQNFAVLSSALNVLISANRDVVPALVTLLSHPHPNLRMHAALALGELSDSEAVPALLTALDDQDTNVRFHAIEALGRLGAVAAVEPLTRIAESGDFFLSFPAIDALARTDDPRVTPNLVGLLSNDLLRPAVVDTLGQLGDEECVAPLVNLLNSRDSDAAPVAAALERMRDRYERTFAAGDQIVEMVRAAISPDGLRHLSQALERHDTPLASLVAVYGWMGAASTDVLVTLIGEPSVRTEVANNILAIGRAAVLPLVTALERDERAGRLASAELLGRLGDRRAVPALCGLLAEADADLVATAAAALATLGDPRAVDSLLPLFGHEQAAVRQAAIAALNAIGAATVEPHVRQRLTDADPHVRECAVRVAGYFGFDACEPGILGALDDPDEDVRRAAIEQLPILTHSFARARLGRALAEETPRNRAAAARAARLADEASIEPLLVAALADPDAWVRYFAACSLGERRHRPAVVPLLKLAEADPAPQVRIAAVQAIGALDADAAVPLAEQFLQEPDTDVARAALGAVAEADNARVDDLLEVAIRSTQMPLRQCAIEAMAARRTSRVVEMLAWAARLTDAPEVAGAALDALSSIAADASEVGSAAVVTLVNIGVEESRRDEAIDALARAGCAAIDAIGDSLAERHAAARLTAVEALARMRHPRASAALTNALNDADPAIRAAAVSGFGRLGSPSAGPVIAVLRESDPDPSVRRKAAIVCRRYGWNR